MNDNNFLKSLDFIDLLLDAIVVADQDGRFIYVSGASEAIFGYKPEELIGKRMWDMVLPADRKKTFQIAQTVAAGNPIRYFENRYIKKNGEVVHILWSARWLQDKKLRIAVAHDISERKMAEKRQAVLYAIAKLTHEAEDLHSLFTKIHHIIQELIPVRHFFIAQYNAEYDQLSFPYYVRSNKELTFDQTTPQGELEYTISRHIINTGKTILSTPFEPYLKQLNDSHCCLLGIPLQTKGQTTGALIVQNDSNISIYNAKDQALLEFVSSEISTAIERKQLLNRLQHLAEFDSLTGLPNRELLLDRLKTAIQRARREQTQLAVLYIDLLYFKAVNDQLGHHIGDQLLQSVASRLQDCVRATDTVARQGGDEFVILIEQIKDSDDLSLVRDKISQAFETVFELAPYRAHISASIGIGIYPQHGDNEQALLQYADQAMYQVKKQQHQSQV